MPRRHLTAFAAFFLFCFGLYFNFIRHLPDLQKSIFGDEGDGFFNLWLLEHVRLFFSHWDLNLLIHTNTFYPENNLTLFWSENQIFPGAIYSLIYFFCQKSILSFNILHFVSVALAYTTHFFLFKKILSWGREVISESYEKQSKRVQQLHDFSLNVLLLIFTYSFTFSMTRMVYTVHFQNQWSFLTLVSIFGMIKILEKSYRLGAVLVCGAATLLCLSSMYYFVTFSMIGLFFGVFLIFSLKKAELSKLIKQSLPSIGVSSVICLPILYAYSLTEKNGLGSGSFSKISQIFYPFPNTLVFNLLDRFGINLENYSQYNHESLIYPGVFLLFLSIPLFLLTLKQAWIFIKSDHSLKIWLSIILIFNAAAWSLSSKFESKALITTMGVGGLLIYILISFYRAVERKVLRSELALLFISAIVFYSVTLGQSVGFRGHTFNPSFFGIFSLINPGFLAMRAAGRLGVLASAMLCGLTFYYLVIKVKFFKPWVCSIVIGLGLLHSFEQFQKPYVNTYPVERVLQLSRDEKEFFSSLSDSILFYPVAPWHKNTYYLLLSQPYENIRLVNGYSGHLPPFLSSILNNSESLRYPSKSLIEKIKLKSRVLVFAKWAYERKGIEEIQENYTRKIFESENYLAYSLDE